MEAIKEHEGKVFPLNRSNVDTDQIIPKQFLKRVERTGFGQFVFHNWRFDDDGNPKPDFELDSPRYKDASVLIAGENFGCGSSREHAPWALLDFGFKVIIAPSFADIFYNNAFKNGIILIKADESQVDEWMEQAKEGTFHLNVDLEEQTISDGTKQIPFDIPSYHKEKLLNGWDDIALTLLLDDKIREYEEKQAAKA
ncbi:3-isopropylmalate dehydratase small subunit [Salinicoccus roseus]|jgi:3-isopropylmalate/(R)-2-methylmalate dehydratase small subunit|uniref:3-isopropylmalate dehydratase small subunit n=1 Tax=Salinicoccus roseus TaxID=45670 RepID=A0A0C2HDD1_9STAP|nr:3-isopropylmalate dehydratase small subunit [Salinicoccus roseus]KIH69684.1 isopropylmalate isomerase [Salinicoccus roseus]MDB0579401.1 3-isopropylmalate dehydratase small subunit [Salinicoccus roseus]OZT78478.1 3-isopropylmalate dehydratase small subunit [Salinicoccus roseus]RPE54581.1 3-isopropylmalate dehydratase small subunit [Salinicoccus roseus]GGA64492.1 3-isopropylmalate dehydratase small subunit [Salinicoccus roseus]|tara:strand:- start:148 stop:738 length:591 start_codon:yes stop_codon:yes gene_type:complete